MARRTGKPPKTPRREPRDLSGVQDRLGWTVGEEEHGARLDRFLLERITWRSRTSIVGLIEAGKVLRDDAPVQRKAARVYRGERVEVLVPPPPEEERHEELALRLAEAVLYEDEDLVALAKPPGIVVHPVGRVRVNTLIQAMHWLYRHGPRPEPRTVPRICHRLDRDTSGVLVLAKNGPARTALGIAIEGHDLEKEYAAVVAGRLAPDSGEVDLPIGPDPEAEVGLMMTTRPDGLPSRTRWAVLERFAEASLVRFTIETGRQHQIRVHARALGHPVLLDPLYGDDRTRWPAAGPALIARQALHARRLVLPHPRTGAPLELEAPLPEDMERLLASLRDVGAGR